MKKKPRSSEKHRSLTAQHSVSSVATPSPYPAITDVDADFGLGQWGLPKPISTSPARSPSLSRAESTISAASTPHGNTVTRQKSNGISFATNIDVCPPKMPEKTYELPDLGSIDSHFDKPVLHTRKKNPRKKINGYHQ
jgi:hypothetical protein